MWHLDILCQLTIMLLSHCQYSQVRRSMGRYNSKNGFGDVEHSQGLEIRFHLRTMKAEYEPGSEDIFLRYKWRSKLRQLGVIPADGKEFRNLDVQQSAAWAAWRKTRHSARIARYD